jgi:hypothetical protein
VNTITLDDLCAVNRLSDEERAALAAPVVSDLMEIEPVSRGLRDSAGIARRGGSVYDEILRARPRSAVEIAAARWELLSRGASLVVIDALESAEVTR